MTWVRNLFQHAYQPTIGPSFGPRQDADIDLSPAAEQDAVSTGGLLVLDDNYVPPDPEPDPLAGDWRTPVQDVADLPTLGNQTGDVRLVMATFTPYVWNGTVWGPMLGASSSVLTTSDDPEPDPGSYPDGTVWRELL